VVHIAATNEFVKSITNIEQKLTDRFTCQLSWRCRDFWQSDG
jgi:hypothetical protein